MQAVPTQVLALESTSIVHYFNWLVVSHSTGLHPFFDFSKKSHALFSAVRLPPKHYFSRKCIEVTSGVETQHLHPTPPPKILPKQRCFTWPFDFNYDTEEHGLRETNFLLQAWGIFSTKAGFNLEAE